LRDGDWGETYNQSGSAIKTGYSVEVCTTEKQLHPNQTAILRTSSVECKHVNDQSNYHFAIPTIDPEIEVRKKPDELAVTIGFGTPTQNIEKSHTP